MTNPALLLLEKVADFMARQAPPGPGVIAVSGGPDSVALVRLLVQLQKNGKVQKLILAHLNHRLRGAESDADETFVAGLARQCREAEAADVDFRRHALDVAALAHAQKDNLERAARRLRYDWLTEIAREEKAPWVATGHTADDQAETVLHRLLRGTGLHGLEGIPRRRQLAPGLVVLRPLLQATRAEVLAFLQAQGQSYREDSSNTDPRFTRNRIRNFLLPELARQFNPGIVEVLCRLAGQARAVQEIIEAETARILAEAELPRAGSMLIFDCARLQACPRHLIQEMFRLVWRRENLPGGSMDFSHWERLGNMVFGPEDVMDFPDGIQVRRKNRVLQVCYQPQASGVQKTPEV